MNGDPDDWRRALADIQGEMLTEYVAGMLGPPVPAGDPVGMGLDRVLAELARLVTVEYQRDEPRERVVQRIASAASVLAGCRQESDVPEIAPDRLAALRDTIRAGREAR